MVFLWILMRHISEPADSIALIFSMVMGYLFIICSVVIFDIPILFETRYPRLPTVQVIPDMPLIRILHVSILPWWLLLIVTLYSPSTFGQIFSIIAIGKLSIKSGCPLYTFFCCVSVAYFTWSNSKSYCISFSALSI